VPSRSLGAVADIDLATLFAGDGWGGELVGRGVVVVVVVVVVVMVG